MGEFLVQRGMSRIRIKYFNYKIRDLKVHLTYEVQNKKNTNVSDKNKSEHYLSHAL